MTPEEQNALLQIRDLWFAGGNAVDLAPESWKQIITGDQQTTQENSLLAIAGQAFQIAMVPRSPTDLKANTALPELSLPIIPEDARQTFRTALKSCQSEAKRNVLLNFIQHRGYASHPFDWMPDSERSEVPSVYLPWLSWIAGRETGKAEDEGELTEETWDGFMPAERRMELQNLRMREPALAKDLLEAKASQEPAEQRLKLVEILEYGLSEDDEDYLVSLLNDRSGKVARLASLYLSRIGGTSGDRDEVQELAKELADFFEMKTGLLRRKTRYQPKKLKTNAQKQRRRELFTHCTLASLCGAMQCSHDQLLETWSFGVDPEADHLLVEMVMQSASQEACKKIALRLMDEKDETKDLLQNLLSRLPDEEAGIAQLKLLRSTSFDRFAWYESENILFADLTSDEISQLPFVKECLSTLKKSEEGKTDHRMPDVLEKISYLTSPESAEFLTGKLLDLGFPFASQELSFLRLSASLTPRITHKPE